MTGYPCFKNIFFSLGILLLSCNSCAHTIKPPALFKKDHITFVAQKKDLDKLLKDGSEYLIVCFTEKHCNTCKKFAGVFSKTAAALSGYDKISFVAFDIFYDISAAEYYGVKGIPTTVILKKGVKLAALPGAIQEQALIQNIETATGFKK